MNILITICARGGSKGIPGKNIKHLNGKYLIDYSIKHAEKFASLHDNVDITLSTDSHEIKDVASICGLNTEYIRPEYLGGDTIGKMDVLHHVLQYEESNRQKKYDFLLDLDVTSPLRTIEDLEEAFITIINRTDALNIFSVSKPNKNPYYNVVELQDDGYCKLVKYSDSKSRQSAPIVYDMNASFYFYRRSFFEQGLKSAITDKSLLFLMDHICFDLDEPLDFEIMEFLLSHNKLDFEI
ncbi:acylneuraminate cytidylyltransferase family protein [uncultured Aquimarina sp.]|uniref:acylneuraminate cytidylyltransferase family protein n=1 Tax=uncultured Aquimarina sp. TaxID=575652 RepID=UPI00263550F2|nr:acylneuraminate cytidylyltransferase family protein [uncultured Aquimarina sp.]